MGQRRQILVFFALSLLAETPEGIPFQGAYENKFGYAYRVTVPPGFTGLKAPPSAPQHGFVIDLGATAASPLTALTTRKTTPPQPTRNSRRAPGPATAPQPSPASQPSKPSSITNNANGARV